jgi:hypothetical protein
LGSFMSCIMTIVRHLKVTEAMHNEAYLMGEWRMFKITSVVKYENIFKPAKKGPAFIKLKVSRGINQYFNFKWCILYLGDFVKQVHKTFGLNSPSFFASKAFSMYRNTFANKRDWENYQWQQVCGVAKSDTVSLTYIWLFVSLH